MFADRFKKLRIKFGFTQKSLAQKLQISPSAVGMYEQGRREPDSKTLLRIANLFGVSTDYLISEKKDRYRLESGDDLPEQIGQILREQESLLFCGRPIDQDGIDLIVKAVREGIHQALTEESRKEELKGKEGEKPWNPSDN